MRHDRIDRSIIIPFYNEEETVRPVLEEVHACQCTAEIIAVDDGSSDRTWEIICSLDFVRGLRLTENWGQSTAIYVGLRIARGDLLILMDGDGQIDPADIESFITRLQQRDADVVCGRRVKRQDTWSRRIFSRVSNSIGNAILAYGVSDAGAR